MSIPYSKEKLGLTLSEFIDCGDSYWELACRVYTRKGTPAPVIDHLELSNGEKAELYDLVIMHMANKKSRNNPYGTKKKDSAEEKAEGDGDSCVKKSGKRGKKEKAAPETDRKTEDSTGPAEEKEDDGGLGDTFEVGSDCPDSKIVESGADRTNRSIRG